MVHNCSKQLYANEVLGKNAWVALCIFHFLFQLIKLVQALCQACANFGNQVGILFNMLCIWVPEAFQHLQIFLEWWRQWQVIARVNACSTTACQDAGSTKIIQGAAMGLWPSSHQWGEGLNTKQLIFLNLYYIVVLNCSNMFFTWTIFDTPNTHIYIIFIICIYL